MFGLESLQGIPSGLDHGPHEGCSTIRVLSPYPERLAYKFKKKFLRAVPPGVVSQPKLGLILGGFHLHQPPSMDSTSMI